jgi:hypothetical protein
MFKFYSS